MANRLSKITTRTGDDGSTGLGDGSRTRKDSLRVETLGEVDELNSHLGVLLAEILPEEIASALLRVQHDLFDLGGELCLPGTTLLQAARIAELEQLQENLNAGLGALQEFILPGGGRTAALAHVARTVCRRAERRLVALGQQEAVSSQAMQYLNRLSDLLFVMARYLNKAEAQADVLWRRQPR